MIQTIVHCHYADPAFSNPSAVAESSQEQDPDLAARYVNLAVRNLIRPTLTIASADDKQTTEQSPILGGYQDR
jgi:hypothetical protein